MRGNIADHKINVVALFRQRTRKPYLRKWDTCDCIKRSNNTNLHFDNS